MRISLIKMSYMLQIRHIFEECVINVLSRSVRGKI